MAARDARFYRLLFKAVDLFKLHPAQSSVRVIDANTIYYVFKKPALKFFRIYTPWYQGSKIEDDNELVLRLYQDSKTNQALINLTKPASSPIIDNKVLDEWEVIHQLPPPQQEKAQNSLAGRIEREKLAAAKPDLATAQSSPDLGPKRVEPPKFKLPGAVLDAASWAKVNAGRLVARFPTLPASLFGAGMGYITGRGLTGTEDGGRIGAAAGGLLPAAVRYGLLNKLPGLGGGLGSLPAQAALRGGLAAAGGAATVATSIWIWVAVLAAIFLIPLFFLILKDTSLLGPDGLGITGGQKSSDSNLSVSLAGPLGCTYCKADNGQPISYEATVTYKGKGNADLEISTTLPANTEPSNLSDEGKSEGNTIKWKVDNLPSGQSKKVAFTIKPLQDDIWLVNSAQAKITNVVVGDVSIGANEPPTDNNCGGRYNLSLNPTGKNFGDPVCSFTKDGLYQTLQQDDPPNADFWFTKVVYCESGHNPNNYFRCNADRSVCTPDPAGAWGLFQMGSSMPGNRSNGIYDKGDVVWQLQTTNAINYYKTMLIPKGMGIASYWQCAR